MRNWELKCTSLFEQQERLQTIPKLSRKTVKSSKHRGVRLLVEGTEAGALKLNGGIAKKSATGEANKTKQE